MVVRLGLGMCALSAAWIGSIGSREGDWGSATAAAVSPDESRLERVWGLGRETTGESGEPQGWFQCVHFFNYFFLHYFSFILGFPFY